MRALTLLFAWCLAACPAAALHLSSPASRPRRRKPRKGSIQWHNVTLGHAVEAAPSKPPLPGGEGGRAPSGSPRAKGGGSDAEFPWYNASSNEGGRVAERNTGANAASSSAHRRAAGADVGAGSGGALDRDSGGTESDNDWGYTFDDEGATNSTAEGAGGEARNGDGAGAGSSTDASYTVDGGGASINADEGSAGGQRDEDGADAQSGANTNYTLGDSDEAAGRARGDDGGDIEIDTDNYTIRDLGFGNAEDDARDEDDGDNFGGPSDGRNTSASRTSHGSAAVRRGEDGEDAEGGYTSGSPDENTARAENDSGAGAPLRQLGSDRIGAAATKGAGDDSAVDGGTPSGERYLLPCNGPPLLTAESILGMVQTYDASYHRQDRLRQLQSNMNITPDDARLVYAGMHRRCSTVFGPPAESKGVEHVALIISGQTRSFLHPLVQHYWDVVMGSIMKTDRALGLFGVLDEISVSVDQKNRTIRHRDSAEKIVKVFKTWVSDAQVAFLHGNSSMAGHARIVNNPELRAILTPKDAADAENIGEGFECGYMKMVIGLDMLLQYEIDNEISFSHVVRSRPDYIHMFLWRPDHLQKVWDILNDAVYVMNDVLAIMPRQYAGAYFTSFLMHRGLKDVSQHDQMCLLDDIIRNGRDGSPLQPTTMLAYHGILFAGSGLELDTWVNDAGGRDSVSYDELDEGVDDGQIVREDTEKGPCFENPNLRLSAATQLPSCI